MEGAPPFRNELPGERGTVQADTESVRSVENPDTLAIARDRERAELRRFREAYRCALAKYRSQPSWKIMLLCRYAYRKLLAGTWRERREFLKWLCLIPLRGFSLPAGLDLEFPTVPEEFRLDPAQPQEASSFGSTSESLRRTLAFAARLNASLLSEPNYREHFGFWKDHGFHLLPVHYESPIPNTNNLPRYSWQQESSLVGIEMNERRQIRLLREEFPRCRDEYSAFPAKPTRNEGAFT